MSIQSRSPGRKSACAALAILVLAGTAGAAVNFTAGVTLATPTRPGGSAIGDFNRDGLADVAVTSDNPDKISIFFGNGSAAFGAPQVILTGGGTGPESLVAVDLNGDGALDLVVSLQNSNTVRSYMNSGSGTFTPGSNVPTGANPRALIAADLDGDGDPDLVAANRDGDSITLIRNTAGSLAAAATIATGGEEPRAVAAADFNHNGVMDLAVTNHRTRTVTILNGAGNFTYSVAATLPVPPNTRPDGVAAADLNGDGFADLAVAISETPAPNVVGIYTNTAGIFSPPVAFNTGGLNPGRVAIADLDMDGKPDIVVANEDSGNVSIFQNTSTPAGISLGAPTIFAVGAHPEQFAIGDLNGNSMPDLAVPNRDANTTSILLNATPSPCRADFNHSGGISAQDIFDFLNAWFANDPLADFNGSGLSVQDLFDFLGAWFTGC